MPLKFIGWIIISLQQCGVQSQGNIALNKRATQSTTFGGAIGAMVAQFAVDGVVTQSIRECKCCAATATGYGLMTPWWKVDLEEEYEVRSVTIYKRTDCCGECFNHTIVACQAHPNLGFLPM